MSRKNPRPLAERVTEAAETALAARHYVSPVDVLLGIGWLDPNTHARWRQGQVACLEDALQTSPDRLAEALTLLRSWAMARELAPSETAYVARTPQRQMLRFSASGNPACLKCVGLDDLDFLSAGDATLTRRAKAKSARHAVVVRFSRSRRRYERQGLLVEPQALAQARRELGEPEEGRR